MAAARYTKIKLFDQRQWIDGCPVVLEKAALLQDNKLDELLFQFKFTNIDTEIITALIIKIECYDIENILLDTVTHHYLDLKVLSGNSFADNEAVKLSFKEIRGFQISIVKVFFESGEEWSKNNNVLRNIARVKSVEELHINREQLKQELELEQIVSDAKYLPESHGAYWNCTCGCINKEPICVKCHIQKNRIMSLLSKYDKDFLNARYEERIKREQEETARQQRAKEQQKLARNKKMMKALIVVVLIFVLIVVNVQIIIPFANDKYTQYQYRTALKLGEEGDYLQAISKLEKLGEYEDCKEKIEEFELRLKYEEAITLGENEEYEKAIQLLEELNGYDNSADIILQLKYNEAQKYIDEGQYKEAEELYEQLGEYEDATAKMREAGELYAEELFSLGKYEEAILYYEKYNFYNTNYKESCYNVALDKQKQEDYEQALEYWKKAEGYRDSSERLTECKLENERYSTYIRALSEIGAGDAVVAKELLTQLPDDYKDVEELVLFCDEYKDILGTWVEYKAYFPVDGKWILVEDVNGMIPSSYIVSWEADQWYVNGHTASFTNNIFYWTDDLGQLTLDVTTGEQTSKYEFHIKNNSEGSKSICKKVE